MSQLAANITIDARLRRVVSAADGSASVADAVSSYTPFAWTNGTGAGQATGLYHAGFSTVATLAAGASVVLNPTSGGGLVDAMGSAIAWTSLKAVMVENRTSSNSAVLSVSGAVSGVARAGGVSVTIAPQGVTAASVTIQNTGSVTATYRVVLVGN